MSLYVSGSGQICLRDWQTLQHQDKCDRLVAELVIGMGHLLPFVDAVTDQAKVLELKTTITNMLHLIEDASRFVVEYKSDGAPGKYNVYADACGHSTYAPDRLSPCYSRVSILDCSRTSRRVYDAVWCPKGGF